MVDSHLEAAAAMTLTEGMIEAGRSPRGGYSRKQLAAIGVPWPPPSGWKADAVGRTVGWLEYRLFLALRAGGVRRGLPRSRRA